MPALFLRILGGFTARLRSSETVVIPIRKGQALLAYLALNPDQAITRSNLAALLWGDHPDERARSNLRETLNVLRKALGPAQDRVLRVNRQSIGVNAPALDVDALTFENLIVGGTAGDLEAAVSLYRGDLLDGLDVSDPGFQTWLEDERRRLRNMMVGALEALILHKRMEGVTGDAILHAQRLLALEPMREDVHRTLIALYAELGRRHAAHQQFQRCRDLLASELNVEPEPETEALYRTLLNGDGGRIGPAAGKSNSIIRERESGRGGQTPRDEGSRPPSAAMAGILRGWRRRAAVASRVLVLGGVAALVWLLAWSYPAMYRPPDLLDRLRLDAQSSDVLTGVMDGASDLPGPSALHRMAPSRPAGSSLAVAAFDRLSDETFKPSSLAGFYRGSRPHGAEPPLVVASIDDSLGALEGMSESSGPDWLYRLTPPRPIAPSLDVASVSDLSGVLARVTGYSSSNATAETTAGDAERSIAHDARLAMQSEADGLWSELANSWDLSAVREFRTRHSDAGQVAEADRRIAFLIARYREAQAELNRLGYDAGYVDGVWGPRSARATRAFQSDHGLVPDGVVSKTLLDRLNTETSKITMASIRAPETQPQAGHSGSEIGVGFPSIEGGIPDGARWTASGEADGSRIFATATRRGDTLELVFDVDLRSLPKFGPPHRDRYNQRCAVSLSVSIVECWIASRPNHTFGAKVSGAFPRLTYEMQLALGWVSGPLNGDIVLEFHPDRSTQDLKTAAQTTSGPASKGPTQSASPPENAMAKGLNPFGEGSENSRRYDGIWVGQTGEGFWKVTLIIKGSSADLRIDHPFGIIRGAGKLNEDGNIHAIIARGLRWEDRWISGSVHRISINGPGWVGEATVDLRKYQG